MKNILFVVEGERDEPSFITKIYKEFRGDSVAICSYKTNIHILIRELFRKDGSMDEDIDLITYLESREKDNKAKEMLKRKFTDVFLVFDMDPHDPSVDLDNLEMMLSFFSDSADNGKLYLNYPMLESYKHLKSLNDAEFADRKVRLSDIKSYKRTVQTECHRCLRNANRYDKELFVALALMHLRKANRILCGNFVLPALNEFLAWDGSRILRSQCSLIREEQALYVLNTCLFNIIDYRPSDFLNNCRDRLSADRAA